MRDIPKATPNNNPFHENDSAVDFVKPKSTVIREAGFTSKQAERFQQLASHPEIVEQAKAKERQKGGQGGILLRINLSEANPEIQDNIPNSGHNVESDSHSSKGKATEALGDVERFTTSKGADGKTYPRKPVSVFNPTKREERAMKKPEVVERMYSNRPISAKVQV